MELSFLEFRYRKQFFGMTAFFLGLLVAFWSGFLQVFCITEHNLPYPQRLFCRHWVDNEKIFRWRTTLTEKSDGDQVAFPATAAFPEQSFRFCFRNPDL